MNFKNFIHIELAGKCKSNDDCYINSEFGSTVCDNGICKCRDGFYQREYRSCRKKASKIHYFYVSTVEFIKWFDNLIRFFSFTDIDEECLADIDCKFNEDAYCVNFKCTLNQKKTSYNRTSQISFNSRYRKFADKYGRYLLKISDNRDTINNFAWIICAFFPL